ncbi:hypothetical protein [Phytohabitans rumicis]|uniref:hypothetical protein n=1 Tax=Phytohabitans rumicis TaxID=1076125 RepID=UPI0031EA3895
MWFVEGVAYVDNGHPFLAYVRCSGGYDVERVDQVPADYAAALAELRALGSFRLGAPTRDAAVDPRPGDYGVPVNAGKANPHGPHVIAPKTVEPWQPDGAPA